jgi:A/G-specific adenine glycosylase
LPWRNTRDAYAIWVSEVMLQQTQVKTVLERYYGPFLARFPTVEALASASQTEVMKAWEGLGYYSRAANLQKAARMVVSCHPERSEGSALVPTAKKQILRCAQDDRFPDTFEELLALPGIGRNTAHAVLAFAYRLPYPVLEANVKRVVARIFAIETPADVELWAAAERLLDRAEPFDYNQAMMDVGAMVCTPKRPACAICPANAICAGKAEPERYPAKKARKIVPTREVRLVMAEDARGRLYLEQRQDRLLGGLYGFPQVPLNVIASEARQSSLTTKTEPRIEAGLPRFARNDGERWGTATHTYSHFKLVAEVVVVQNWQATNRGGFFTRAEIEALPLSKIDHKALAVYDARLDKAARRKA